MRLLFATILIGIAMSLAVIPSDMHLVVSDSQKEIKTSLEAKQEAKTEEIRGYVREHAKLMGVNPDLAEDLAYWESGFNPRAKNKNSSASGIFQFTTETWEQFCTSKTYNPSVFDWKANVDCALRIIYWEGLDRWKCDPVINKLLKENGYL